MNLQKKLSVRSVNAVSKHHRVLAFVGPTAAGKTQAALELAKLTPSEIICADSRTIYRGMDIGTAKPTAEECLKVPHYGLDLIDPGSTYSAAEFIAYARSVLAAIWSRGKLPLLVGGSGMYIDALLFGYQFRNEQHKELLPAGLSDKELLNLANDRYPDHIHTIDVKNTRRLRQLITRGPVNSADREQLKYNAKIIGIDPGIEKLQMRIEKRTDVMLKQGFVQECKKLRDQYGDSCAALQTTGYSAVMSYLTGEINKKTMRTQIITDTRRLAKKQRTWFKRNPFITWVQDVDEAVDVASSYLTE